jgi:hypothetical protein
VPVKSGVHKISQGLTTCSNSTGSEAVIFPQFMKGLGWLVFKNSIGYVEILMDFPYFAKTA